MEQIIKRAKAKINLGLDVIRRREDGYHEVKMIMQSVDIMDILTFTKTKTHGIKIIAGDSAVAEHIPTDDRNLIYKAAKLLLEKFPERITGVEIHLEKNIPVAAGMAGGSTDAASTLTAMNELFELELSVEELMRFGVKIGADVPYCIIGGTALSEGIGEILTPVSTPPFCYLVIAKPDLYVSTKFVYENLKLSEDTKHPDIDALLEAIKEGDLHTMAKRMENILETVTVVKYPVIEEIKEMLCKFGALNALMSGSGPTVFGIFENEGDAKKAYDTVWGSGLAKQIFITTLS